MQNSASSFFASSCENEVSKKFALPELNLRRTRQLNTIRNPSELVLLIRNTLTDSPECHIPYETIRLCWELNLLHDSKWRREAINAFAEENSWVVDQTQNAAVFRMKRENVGD